jgi:hypothetical protein
VRNVRSTKAVDGGVVFTHCLGTRRGDVRPLAVNRSKQNVLRNANRMARKILSPLTCLLEQRLAESKNAGAPFGPGLPRTSLLCAGRDQTRPDLSVLRRAPPPPPCLQRRAPPELGAEPSIAPLTTLTFDATIISVQL